MKLRIINYSPRITEEIDYNNVIFVVEAANILDMDRSDQLWIFLKTIIQGESLKVLIDMSGLEFIDSIGIGVIINTAKMLRSRKGDVALLNVPVRIEKIFKPVNLKRFIKMFETEEDAVNFFRLV